MSMKNRVLLHRNGRDQYGNKGSAAMPVYQPSENEINRTNEMRKLHIALNQSFIQDYGAQWVALFKGMSKKDIWSFLYPHGKPSLATFYNHSRAYSSLEDYLYYLLVHNKLWSLSKLGVNRDQAKNLLEPFRECGRYMVSYKGGTSFGTSI